MPQIIAYKYLAGAVVSLLALIGAFFFGMHLGKLESDVAIERLKGEKATQQAQYEGQIALERDKIVTKVVDRWHTIKETQYVNTEAAKNVVPSQYELSNGWVSLHDSAARAEKVDGSAAADGTPSGIRDNQALVPIINNYALYHRCQAQVNGLLDLIDKHNATIDQVNKGGKK